eukprot:5626742-Amphidinium_carterae.3
MAFEENLPDFDPGKTHPVPNSIPPLFQDLRLCNCVCTRQISEPLLLQSTTVILSVCGSSHRPSIETGGAYESWTITTQMLNQDAVKESSQISPHKARRAFPSPPACQTAHRRRK